MIGVALFACSDPTSPNVPPNVRVLVVNGAQIGLMLAGELARIVPSLPAGTSRDNMSALCLTLASAVSSGTVQETQSALTACTAAVDRFESTNAINANAAADLSGLRLAIDVVHQALP